MVQFTNVDGTYRGFVEHFTPAKEIHVRWCHVESGTRQWQRFKLAYWPTALCLTRGRQGFCVAGKRESGNTVIERWVLQPPTLIEVSDGCGVPPAYILRALAARRIDDMYDDAIEGRDLVTVMAPVLGKRDTFLILAHDSRDVWELDATTSPANWRVIASSRAPAPDGAIYEPALAELAPDRMEPLHHVVHGFVYHLFSPFDSTPSLLLFDADQDGSVESALECVGSTWTSMGFGDSISYRSVEF